MDKLLKDKDGLAIVAGIIAGALLAKKIVKEKEAEEKETAKDDDDKDEAWKAHMGTLCVFWDKEEEKKRGMVYIGQFLGRDYESTRWIMGHFGGEGMSRWNHYRPLKREEVKFAGE